MLYVIAGLVVAVIALIGFTILVGSPVNGGGATMFRDEHGDGRWFRREP